MAATDNKIETPVNLSPFSIVLCTGAAPRYRGNKLGWIFKVPNLGILKKFFGK